MHLKWFRILVVDTKLFLCLDYNGADTVNFMYLFLFFVSMTVKKKAKLFLFKPVAVYKCLFINANVRLNERNINFYNILIIRNKKITPTFAFYIFVEIPFIYTNKKIIISKQIFFYEYEASLFKI